MALEYDYWKPELDTPHAGRVLILMHGRGANRQDLAALRGRLPRSWHVLVPDAPHAAAPWGYGPGRAWYRYLGDDRVDLESVETSVRALDALIAGIPTITGNAASQVVVGGFSQGGTTGHAYALQRAGAVQGVLNFSGFLPSNVAFDSVVIANVRFFWGHGVRDANIPFEHALKGRAALRAAGAEVDARDYDIGHWIDPDELRDASAWLESFHT